ncbi:hypothetical protein GmHk_18G051988 [Glycine max]|nr:hypothetical protein GmHk_18G051988 [Glycine max]
MSRNFTDYATIPSSASGMLQNFTDCAIMFPFDSRHVENFTYCLTMGVKFLEAVKRRLHAIKQWSPDEIRGSRLDGGGCMNDKQFMGLRIRFEGGG